MVPNDSRGAGLTTQGSAFITCSTSRTLIFRHRAEWAADGSSRTDQWNHSPLATTWTALGQERVSVCSVLPDRSSSACVQASNRLRNNSPSGEPLSSAWIRASSGQAITLELSATRKLTLPENRLPSILLIS